MPRRVRQARALAGLLAVAALALILASCIGSAPGKSAAGAQRDAETAHRAAPAAVESGLLPWRLRAPLSREVALAGPGGRLVLLGGLTAARTSASDVVALDTRDGRARRIGSLAGPLHDAAGAALGTRELIFGGGTAASVATVQRFTPPASGRATAAVTGRLPTVRSDATAVTIGPTAYVVGGYTGTGPDAAVLATSDGQHLRTVAALRVPVRYPAVAAAGGKIYVFGGEAVTGPQAGKPVDTIQVIDPVRRTASLAGRLPEPLQGAAAVTIGGQVYVAGGTSSTRQPRVPGAGSTQFGSVPAGPTDTVSTIWAFDPGTGRMLTAGHLQVPVSNAGAAVIGGTAWIAGGESNGAPVAAVQMLRPDAAFGQAGAPGAGSPYFGARLLIADRGNNRLLLLDDTMRLLWKYPSSHAPPSRFRFYFPDDAFFIRHGTAIISNQEQNNTIVEIGYPSGKIVWSYGHPRQAGTGRGYLHEPDDAYLLRNGQITVADAYNCRVLVINSNGTVAHQVGTDGACVHHPPASMGTPNGDTPLADGNLLVSEINGSWVTEYTPAGRLVWTVQLPIAYPSDPQQLGPDRYLIADYAAPGEILEFTRAGRILYRYAPRSGPGMLNHPSLTELLPSGVFMSNDDYNDRMVATDPATGALVWQYGVTGSPGRGPGRLHTPDGFDVILPNGSTPTHRFTG